jgi:hypothetical protein
VEGCDAEGDKEGGLQRQGEEIQHQNLAIPFSQRGGPTPASGINLISGSDSSQGSVLAPVTQVIEKDILIQAAKLLSIQKEVGFNFEEPEGESIKQLVEQEIEDRTKKMEWENKEGDQ